VLHKDLVYLRRDLVQILEDTNIIIVTVHIFNQVFTHCLTYCVKVEIENFLKVQMFKKWMKIILSRPGKFPIALVTKSYFLHVKVTCEIIGYFLVLVY